MILRYLESSHVTRIAGILQTILVALQEEFEKEPEKRRGGKISVLLVVINGHACATRLFLTQIMFKRIFAATDYSASFDNCFKEFKKFNFEDVMMIAVEKKSYWHRSLNKIDFYDLHLSST